MRPHLPNPIRCLRARDVQTPACAGPHHAKQWVAVTIERTGVEAP